MENQDILEPQARDSRGWFQRRVRLQIQNCQFCGKPNPRKNGHQYKTCSLSCGANLAIKNNPNLKNNIRKAIARLYGNHGFGRAQRDNVNHKNAKAIRVRNPFGVVYEIKNITSWCRKNEHLFIECDNPSAKLPLWRRAQVGLTSIACGDRCSWFGWTAVCVFDIESDPLERRAALQPNSV